MVQEYIYHKGLYLREPEYKPIVRAKAISFENQGQPGWEVLDHLGNTVLYRNPEAEAVLSRIGYEKDQLLILKNAAEGDRSRGLCKLPGASV